MLLYDRRDETKRSMDENKYATSNYYESGINPIERKHFSFVFTIYEIYLIH